MFTKYFFVILSDNQKMFKMKYLCLISALLMLTISVNSQNITIDNSDMPTPNIYTVSKMANITFNPDETGTDYTWDFSFLDYDTQVNDTFFSVSDAPYVYQYSYNNPLDPEHKATVVQNTGTITNAIQVIEITDNYDYFKNSSSLYVKVGAGSTINGVPTVMKYDDVENITTNFPIVMDATNSSVSSAGNDIPSIGYYGQTVDRVNIVDGFGELTTPYGAFQTVRIKSILNVRDTIYYDDYSFGTAFDRPEAVEFNWYADNQSIPLLTVTSTVGNNYSATYKDSIRSTEIITVNSNTSFNIYPTVTSNIVNIEFESESRGKYEIRVFNEVGSELYFVEKNKEIGINSTVISMNEIVNNNGIYFIVFESGNKINLKKVIFSK